MRSRLQAFDARVDGVAVAIVIGLGLIAYFAMISPAIGRGEQAAASEVQLAEAQAQSRDLDRAIATLHTQLGDVQQDLKKHSIQLEPASQLNVRLARLTELAAASKLRVDAIEPGSLARFDRYSTMPIRMSGQGGYRNCAEMLRSVRSEMPDVAVIGLRLSAAPSPTHIVATFQFDLIWHTLPEPAPAKK